MKILFIGPKFGNSFLLFKTIKYKFKNTRIIDTRNILPIPKISNKIFHHISPYFFEKQINHKILENVKKNMILFLSNLEKLLAKS